LTLLQEQDYSQRAKIGITDAKLYDELQVKQTSNPLGDLKNKNASHQHNSRMFECIM
jgi:hypothetical protein